LIEREIESWPDECKPLVLVAEGIGEEGRRDFGPPDGARVRVIVDPIDGTRGLMYDKRSAWFLAAVAENRGEETCLADTFAAVMVELPTSPTD
jgi:fructose-1,6-bisphosphatase/inositol monophosphatase family enzyme